MKAKIFLLTIFVLFFLCFGGVGVFMTVLVVQDAQRINLAQTGRTVQAETVRIHSDLTVNEQAYYAVEVRFEDENGVHTGWTSSSFLYWEAEAILKEGKIEICVDEQYRLVEAGYTGAPYIRIAKLLQLVFGGVGLAFLGIFLWQVVGLIRKGRLIRTGRQAQAALVSAFSNTRINGKPMYCLKLGFTDDCGLYREFCTSSLFSAEEKDRLEEEETLPVRYSDKEEALDLKALKKKGLVK